MLSFFQLPNFAKAVQGFGRWSVQLKDENGKAAVPHKCQVKVRPLAAERAERSFTGA